MCFDVDFVQVYFEEERFICSELVRRLRRRSISSELINCGGGVRIILLLPLVTRCLETIDVCIWRMFVLCLL